MMALRRIVLLLSMAVGLTFPLRAQQQKADPLPPGSAHDIVATACSQCHSILPVTLLRESPAAWRYQVFDMIERGAQIAEPEVDGVVSYLSTNFGPGVPVPGQEHRETRLPEGQGKEVVEGACAICHGLDRVTAARRSRQQWQAIVQRMTFLGAPVSSDQTKDAVDYLASELGTSSAQPK